MTHKTVRNNGQKTKFYVVDHHAPIISRDVWNLVQEKLKSVTRGAPKTTKKLQTKKQSTRIKAFSRLRCGILKKDGITFHRTISRTNRGNSAVYVCCLKKHKGHLLNGRTTTIRTKSWLRKVILTNFDRIKLDERAYIKYEMSTLV